MNNTWYLVPWYVISEESEREEGVANNETRRVMCRLVLLKTIQTTRTFNASSLFSALESMDDLPHKSVCGALYFYVDAVVLLKSRDDLMTE